MTEEDALGHAGGEPVAPAVGPGHDPAEAASRRPRTLATAAIATYGTNLGVALLSLANVFVVARALGPTGRGDVAFLMSVPQITAYLASLGLQEATANIGGSQPETRPRLATNSLLAGLGLSAVAALALVALVEAFPAVGGQASRSLFWLALVVIPLIILKIYMSFLLQSDYRFAITNLAWISGPLTTATLNSLLAALGVITVGTAISVWIGGQLIGTLLVLVYVGRHVGFGRPDARLARRMFSFGAKSHLSFLMGLANYRADQWFIGAMVGSRELGLYSVATAWAESLFYVPGVIILLQRPDLVRATRAEAAELAARVFRRALFLATAMGVVLFLAAPALCEGVFGRSFHGSVVDLRLLAIGALGVVALQLLTNALIAQRRPLLGAAPSAVGFVLTLGLDIALIPHHGGIGAAVATSAAYTAGGVCAVVLFVRVLKGRAGDLVPRPDDLMWYWRKVKGSAPTGRQRPEGDVR